MPIALGSRTPAPAGQDALDLQITEVRIGAGAEAQAGKSLTVRYTGRLNRAGTVFDSTDGKEPLLFTLGIGQVIRGSDQGISGMKVGGRRRLQIPPDLAYGATGAPPLIPPSATLLFDVELLKAE